MKRADCIRFLNKQVSVGVLHLHENRPFYFYGIIKEITKDYLVLSYAGGVKQIPLVDIVEIHINKNTRRENSDR